MSPRVLVVDDEPEIVKGLAYLLEREQFEVEIASDGERAVDLALSGAFDIVLLDLMLPKLSGAEACRRIRAQSAVPIIMLTAKDSALDLVVGFEIGADDYVTKPFVTAELLSRIRALLRRRELDRGADGLLTVQIGEIRIDRVHGEVTVDGLPVSLTPSELKILNLLATTPGAAFTRRQIMEHLWSSDHVGDEHTCEVHISSLRRKIERAPTKPERIVTVRGVGYKLEPA